MQNAPEIAAEAMQKAHALAQAGDLAGAAKLCRTVLARAPAHVYALFMLGTIESQFGHYEEAATHLALAVKLSPQTAEILTSYGNVLLELKRYAEAIDVLSRAIRLQPQNQNALIYRGLALAQSGRPEDALKDFDRVLLDGAAIGLRAPQPRQCAPSIGPPRRRAKERRSGVADRARSCRRRWPISSSS